MTRKLLNIESRNLQTFSSSAVRCGGAYNTCQLKLKHLIYRGFKSPNPLKKGAKDSSSPPFQWGLGGIENLGSTSKNFEMLIRLGFHIKLTLMHICPYRGFN